MYVCIYLYIELKLDKLHYIREQIHVQCETTVFRVTHYTTANVRQFKKRKIFPQILCSLKNPWRFFLGLAYVSCVFLAHSLFCK